MHKDKKSLLISAISLILCAAMLMGTTYAYFSDFTASNDNIVQSGGLDIDMLWTVDLENGPWVDTAKAQNEAIFSYDRWEPGYTEVRYFKIQNKGDLAFKYSLQIVPNQQVTNLSDVIDVYYVENPTTGISGRRDLLNLPRSGVLTEVINGTAPALGVLLPKDADTQGGKYHAGELTLAVALKMQESAGNEYQGKSIGGTFTVQLYATQFNYEEDTFGSDYDSGATLPSVDLPDGFVNDGASEEISVENNLVQSEVTLSGSSVEAVVPAGVAVEENTTALTLSVSSKENTEANISLNENETVHSLDVHIDGVAADNTKPMTITLRAAAAKGLNEGNLELYHVEDGNTVKMAYVASGEFTAHNQFKYDPATGDVVLYMASFSEVAVVSDTENKWNGTIATAFAGGSGTEADPYIIANADQLAYLGDRVSNDNANYGSAHYKLISDINMGGESTVDENGKLQFYPIGYTGEGYKGAFTGTFDGAGHRISNIFQNTWMLVGTYDGTYYNAAMGLFGYVNGGTVKNLTVDHFSSDGEFTPTGVIAAYADGDSTFANIAITNCNPRVYNTGNGGIIGIAGDTSAANDDHITLTNITVDNSNKISALWGSWDVACGGLVGMYRGNVDSNGNATGDTISFNNCHVAAQIDVYNDVCANYQYYAYRYAGMMIGSIRHNTTNADGKTIPNMAGISATGCTVNYGDWNDYYYCEFEKNSMASYSEDYQFSRVPHSELKFTDSNGNGVVDADERASVTGCKHTHTANEDKQAVYLPFHQLFTGYSWGVSSIGLKEYSGIVTDLGITEGDQNESVKKFETKFTGDFLYRVGNQNNIKVSSLFAAAPKLDENGEALKDNEGQIVYWDINDPGVHVRIDKLYDDANVTCKFTPSTTENWGDGILKFEGTGVVDIVIQDYDYCEPTNLHLEVVDAVNATTATNATANNVVLLNDCGFSSLEVSGGYTLYGNGFTMTCGSDSPALDMGYSFVTLNNGTLDNVQIVCPNFDYAALYKSNLTSSDNRSETTNGTTRYYNAKSGVMASGNSQILNSRISGGRASLNVTGGNVVVDNSRIELGAVASILVGSANSLTLRDTTLIQKPTVSTHDSSKTLMGFSVLLVCNSNGDAAPVTLEGTLVQNAWVDEADSKYVPSAGQNIITSVLSNEEYTHDLDGDGTRESLNLGFAYMPESTTSAVNTSTITDKRANQGMVPYGYAEVPIAKGKTYVYSYKYSDGETIPDEYGNTSDYVPDAYGAVVTVTYSDTAEGLTTGKSYGTDGWVYELNVDLDKVPDYALDFSKLSMSVNGMPVTDFKVNGDDEPAAPEAVTAGGTTYTLTATVDGKDYSALFKVTGTETTKESPSLVASNYEAALLVGEAGSMFSKDTWHGAAPVLNGIQVKYWSVAEKQYKIITLSDYTPTTVGKQNGTNAEWTYSPANGDFTLTIKNETAVHSGNSVYAMPVVFNSKLYFVPSGSNGLVNYGNSARTIKINYYFKDNNGGDELKFDHTWSIECENGNTCYDYSDCCNGASKTFTIKSSNGDGCLTPDTLISLADGTQKEIQYVRVGDEVLVWNFYTGKYEVMPVSLLQAHSTGVQNVLHLYFEDGTELKILGEHGVFDADLKTFVFIDEYDVQDYVGHCFVKQDGEGFKTVRLVGYEVTTEHTTAYTILSGNHYNVLAEGMFTVTPAHVGDNFFNPFDIGEDMKYEEEAVKADIEKYGLYTYEDFDHVLTYEQFTALNLGHFKVSVGKGYVTYDGLIYLIENFVNNEDFNR